MNLKLGMQHQRLKLYKVYINDDPELTLTYFMASSDVDDFAMGKTITQSFNGKYSRPLTNI